MEIRPTRNIIVLYAAISALLALSPALQAQMVTTNSGLVSYTYNSSSVFVPDDPLANASGTTSTFSFNPTGFQTSIASGAWSIAATNGVVGLSLDANPGLYFDGPIVVNLNAVAKFNYVVPLATSSVGAVFTAPFTLYVTEVNSAPFANSLLQYSSTVPISPSYITINGPLLPPGGSETMTGALSLDINAVKLHFGLGVGSNITGLRLQISPSLTVWGENASANISVNNFDVVTPVVVPEPTTYALLALGCGAIALRSFRRRQA